MSIDIGVYSKAIAGAVGAGLVAAITALQDGVIDGAEWATIAGAVLVAAGAIWAIPNLPSGVGRYGKAITAALVAALGVLVTALADGNGISQVETVQLVLALLNGAQVFVVPNAAESDGADPPADLYEPDAVG